MNVRHGVSFDETITPKCTEMMQPWTQNFAKISKLVANASIGPYK